MRSHDDFAGILVVRAPHPSLGKHADTYARVIGTFSDIRERSFSWQAHALAFDGSTWDLQVDIRFERQSGG